MRLHSFGLFALVMVAACAPGGERVTPGHAQLHVAAQHLTFPPTPVGSTSSVELPLRNEARLPLELELEGGSAPFGSEAEHLALAPGESRSLRLTFTPAQPGQVQGTLRVRGAAGTVEVVLDAVGLQQPDCAPAGACARVHLDVHAGRCVVEPLEDGTRCQEPCVEDGVCRAGTCVGTARSCDDGNACTLDACGAQAGCVSRPILCEAPDNPCLAAVCDAAEGCITSAVEDGTPCGPQACGVAHVCLAGRCEDRRPGPRAGCAEDAGAQLSAGGQHTCVLGADGQVRCWGAGGQGQLGDGSATDRALPSPVPGLAHVVQVAAGGAHTCAVDADGSAWCWGSNGHGQLGVGSQATGQECSDAAGSAVPCALSPRKVAGLSGVRALAAGPLHTCALRVDGSVWCWGYTQQGPPTAGAPRSLVPERVGGLSTAHAVAAAPEHSCAVLADTSLVCWGRGVDGSTASEPRRLTTIRARGSPLTGVVEVAAGYDTCLRVEDGRVLCFGHLHTPEAALTEVPGTRGAVRVAGTWATHCALLPDGGARCWGEGSWGQLGDGLAQDRSSLAPVAPRGLGAVAAVVPGRGHTCALMLEGGYRCWGQNVAGQLGDGGWVGRVVP